MFQGQVTGWIIVYHKVFEGGSIEVLVIHVKEVLSLIKIKHYYDYYDGAVMKKEDCTQRFMAAQKKSDDSIADPTTTQ